MCGSMYFVCLMFLYACENPYSVGRDLIGSLR